LAEAARNAEDGRITQFLAGVPVLLERYRTAPAAAKALIEAAMDARRLGHSVHLGHSLLEAAAPGYLTDQQWDALEEDWLEQALVYCAVPCRGARGLLTRTRPRPGQPVPAEPHYRLADYLEQTGRAMRRTVQAPVALWDSFMEHADELALVRIAAEAERGNLDRHALRLYQRAAEAGDVYGLRRAAELLEGAGRIDEIGTLYQRAAENVPPYALRPGARLLEGAGRIDEAIVLYRRAVEAGDVYALRRAARLLGQAGRIAEAISLYQRAAEPGMPPQVRWVGRLLKEAGWIDEAIGFYRRAAEAGDPDASGHVVDLLKRVGRRHGAEELRQYGLNGNR
jgi:tetratricopeptide (TPR) repeat protein